MTKRSITPPEVAEALARTDVQSVIRRWRGATFRVRCLGHSWPDHFFALGEIAYGDGKVERSPQSVPSPGFLARELPGAVARPAVRAALEAEIGRDLRRVRNQMSRAVRRQDLRHEAFARTCWRDIEQAVRSLVESHDPEALKDHLTTLVDKAVVEKVMTS